MLAFMQVRQFFEYLGSEWSVISGAPLTFVVSLALAGVLLWLLASWIYKNRIEDRESRISNKDGEIAILQRRLEEYQSKLDGASPDEAKARLDALESRIDALAPRRLNEDQRNAMAAILDPFRGNSVHVLTDMAAPDGRQMAQGLQAAFAAAGWNTEMPQVMGPGNPPHSGVGLIVADPNNMTPAQSAIRSALAAANLPFDVQQGWQRSMPGQPEIAAEILVTSRLQD